VKGSRGRWLRRLAAGTAGLALVALGVIVVQPLWAFSALARVEPRIVWRADVSEKLIALSFDDGPSPRHTPQVLDILARRRARATFFLIGERAAAHPELLETLRAGGHEIGNHSISIRSTVRASDDAFVETLLRTERILGLTSGGPKLFRPPGGKIRGSQIQRAAEHGYRVVLGSAYPYDGGHPPPGYIRWIVTKNLAPGVIVILHDGIPDPSRMIAVLDPILAEGERRGYRFVSIGDLLARERGTRAAPRRTGSTASTRWWPARRTGWWDGPSSCTSGGTATAAGSWRAP
jgi:peptidoglycan/xylan/chitin deacetylase (PgdA/CDA1 family)